MKDKGLFELNYKSHGDVNNYQFEFSRDHFDFKVIRTPISNRTFVIGGVDHSLIKEIKELDKNISVIIVFLLLKFLFEFRLYNIIIIKSIFCSIQIDDAFLKYFKLN